MQPLRGAGIPLNYAALDAEALTAVKKRQKRSRTFHFGSPAHQKADPGFRISLLTCVGTAGFEPATP
jgi:hypothetical protein